MADRCGSLGTLLAMLLAIGCGSTSLPPGDLPETDAGGSTSDDAGSQSSDAGGASGDAGSAPDDAGSTPADAGVPGSPTVSDPVTERQVGAHATYDVGPGKQYEEPDTVPWGSLVAGDVVNIFHRAEPYRWKLCLRGQGTEQAPIVVNGVTDASGHRPKFDFDGARTASGCNPGGSNDIFNTGSQWSLEDYGGIVLKPGVDDAWGSKPRWIVIRNLELHGAARGKSFVDLSGQTVPYAESPAGIWIQPSADVLLENNLIYDNAFGVFTMSKDSTLQAACERIVVRSNRIWGNGVAGSYLEHNLYIQSTRPIIEGNYFGPTREGSEGSTYKSRSSGEVFRYNHVEASARAIDWVYSEDQTPGIATQSDYGVDYAYGNVIVNDCSLGRCAANPIHYGGDNLGEQESVAAEFVPTTPYRSHLYFFNNTVTNRTTTADSWRTAVFDLSLRGTTVDAWNNVFYFEGNSNFSWVELAGKLRLQGTNLAYGATVADSSDQALSANYSVTRSGTLLTSSPAFAALASHDLRPGAGSGAIDAATGVPAGVLPQPGAGYAHLPVAMEPLPRSNGLSARTRRGAALDLGALEAAQ